MSSRVLQLWHDAEVVPLGDGEPQSNEEGVSEPEQDAVPDPEPDPLPKPIARRTAVEQHKTDTAKYLSPEQQRQLERNEGPLVEAFAAHLRGKGHDVDAVTFELTGRERIYRADLVDFTRHVLVEAKFQPRMDDLRTAIGQLAHYSFLAERAVTPVQVIREVVLFGSEPDVEIKELVDALNLGLVWRDGDRFRDQPEGAFV